MPSLCLAAAIWVLSQRYVAFTLMQLPGTLCHELAHFVAGLLTFARPVSLSIIPRREGKGYRLGEVKLANARWYNSAFTALAPLLLALIPWWVAVLRTRGPGISKRWTPAWPSLSRRSSWPAGRLRRTGSWPCAHGRCCLSQAQGGTPGRRSRGCMAW